MGLAGSVDVYSTSRAERSTCRLMVEGPLLTWRWYRRGYLLSSLMTCARWLCDPFNRELLEPVEERVAGHAPWQCAYKEGRSEVDMDLIIMLMAQKSMRGGLGFVCASAGVQKDFGNVSRVRLLQSLGRRGVPPHISAWFLRHIRPI
eukprot:8902143-Pyramimonas_sp.AAC.1